MKKTLLLLVTLALTLSGSSQDYIPFLSGNSIWKSYGIDNSQPSTEVNIDVEYRLSGDTVIEGMDYRILEIDQFSPSSNYPNLGEAYLREDIEEKKVYIRFQEEDQIFFNDNEEILLYDFSLEEGDIYELYEDFDGNEVNILADTTYTIDGEERRAWITDFPAIITDTPHRVYVEGLGFLSDPLMPIFPDQFTFYRSYLYCYSNSDNDVEEEFSYPWVPEVYDCNATLSSQDNYPEEAMIYPNPATGKFTIQAENIRSVRVRDVVGKTIFIDSEINKDVLEVYTSGFQNGIYLVEICDSAANCSVQRLVIDR